MHHQVGNRSRTMIPWTGNWAIYIYSSIFSEESKRILMTSCENEFYMCTYETPHEHQNQESIGNWNREVKKINNNERKKKSAALDWILNESTVQSLFYGKAHLVLSPRFYRFVCVWIWESSILLLNQPRHGQVGKGEAAKQVTLRGLSNWTFWRKCFSGSDMKTSK